MRSSEMLEIYGVPKPCEKPSEWEKADEVSKIWEEDLANRLTVTCTHSHCDNSNANGMRMIMMPNTYAGILGGTGEGQTDRNRN